MRIVFMGTPDFSVPTLKALVEAGHDVAAVVTQPDKPKGRGKEMQMTPVKVQALEYKIPVYQPAKVRDQEMCIRDSPEGFPGCQVHHGCVRIFHVDLPPRVRIPVCVHM